MKIIVDTMTQVQNVIRTLEQKGWKANWEEKDDDYYITATR